MALSTQTTRLPRTATPARWQAAAQRAIEGRIQVRQLAGSGQWIATSGTDASTAYELEVTGAIAHGCTCPAGLNDDPVCRHRAAFYLLVGALTIAEPAPPAPAVAFAPRGEGRYDVLVRGTVYGRAVAHDQGHWELYQRVGGRDVLRCSGNREYLEQRLAA